MPTDPSAARATLVDPAKHGLWDLDGSAIRQASFVEAAESLWAGWRVVHLAPYEVRTGDTWQGIFAAVVLTRTDGVEGWATYPVRLGSLKRTVADAVSRWPEYDDDTSRRLSVGWYIAAAMIRADLTVLGADVADRCTGNLGSPQQAPFHRPWQWKALWELPVEAVPEVEQARLMWALQGVPVPDENWPPLQQRSRSHTPGPR